MGGTARGLRALRVWVGLLRLEDIGGTAKVLGDSAGAGGQCWGLGAWGALPGLGRTLRILGVSATAGGHCWGWRT